MDTHQNLLLCGYLRRFEKSSKIIIPKVILEAVDLYCIRYKIFGIGANNHTQFGQISTSVGKYEILSDLQDLTPSWDNIFLNQFSVSVITVKGELYVAGKNDQNRLGIQQTV